MARLNFVRSSSPRLIIHAARCRTLSGGLDDVPTIPGASPDTASGASPRPSPRPSSIRTPETPRTGLERSSCLSRGFRIARLSFALLRRPYDYSSPGLIGVISSSPRRRDASSRDSCVTSRHCSDATLSPVAKNAARAKSTVSMSHTSDLRTVSGQRRGGCREHFCRW
jgi:hypothetical protein